MSETDAIVTAGQKRALLQRLLMPWWTLVFPLLGLLAIAISLYKMGAAGTIAAAFILIGCVLAAVHQAEVVVAAVRVDVLADLHAGRAVAEARDSFHREWILLIERGHGQAVLVAVGLY